MTEQERLEYLNKVLYSNYTSLDEVEWGVISISQKLSEDFIREFKDKVDWELISKNQKLSEDFIREFKDKVSWPEILHYQTLSEEFKEKYYNNETAEKY